MANGPGAAQDPLVGPLPGANLFFTVGEESTEDLGRFCSKLDFYGTLNGGYRVEATLVDPQLSMLEDFIDNGYLASGVASPIVLTFQLNWDRNGGMQLAADPQRATRPQQAILVSMAASGDSERAGKLTFTAVDPTTYYLSRGDAAGNAYTGSLSQILGQVIERYAPAIKTDISVTNDSRLNKWYMMRQDPLTFIRSTLEWASSITPSQTKWLLMMDGYNLTIKEQAQIMSKQRAFYRYYAGSGASNLEKWWLLADNALNLVDYKLVTQGMSSTTGKYLDRVTDQQQNQVFVSDQNTAQKQIATVQGQESFLLPTAGGMTSIPAIPEVYSGGEIGLDYEKYIAGRARGLWLGLVNGLLRLKIRTIGHGEWSDTMGIGVDTVFLRWLNLQSPWFTAGNWMVTGFHHHYRTMQGWKTDLYLARWYEDSDSKQVP